MNKFFIFLLIILLILLIFICYNESYDIEDFNNLENNITFSLYPKLDNNGNYNNLNINVISSNFLYLNDGVYSDYINDLKDINEKRIISYDIKNNIGSSAKDHTQGGKYWPSFTFSQGKNYSSMRGNAMIRHPLEKLYLINNSDTNDNSMELKDGQYYFNIIGQKKNGKSVPVNYTIILNKSDVDIPNIELKEQNDTITSDNDFYYVKGFVKGGEDRVFFKPKTNKIFRIDIETTKKYDKIKIELRSTYDDNVIYYTDHYETKKNKKCIKNCRNDSNNKISGFQNINEEDNTEKNYFNLYHQDNNNNYEYDKHEHEYEYDEDEYEYDEDDDIEEYSMYDSLLDFFGYEREFFGKKFRKRFRKRFRKIFKIGNPVPVYKREYLYKYNFYLDKHIDYNLKLDLAPVRNGKFKILRDNLSKDHPNYRNNMIWRNLKDSYGAEYLEDDKNFNYNNEVNKRYLIDNNSGVKVSNYKDNRFAMGLEDSGTLMFKGINNNSMYGSKFFDYINRNLDKDNKILTTTNSSFNISVINNGNENVHQLNLIYNFLTTINNVNIIQIIFDTNKDLVTFYDHMHKIYLGPDKVIKKKHLTLYESINSNNANILLIVNISYYPEQTIENWLTETIGLSTKALSEYKVYGFN